MIICKKHGIFKVTPNNHLHGSECPICQKLSTMSILEKQIYNLLNELNINFEIEKTFDWLKYKKPMRLDFYIPKLNIAIEC